jgi:hypothetical protein
MASRHSPPGCLELIVGKVCHRVISSRR